MNSNQKLPIKNFKADFQEEEEIDYKKIYAILLRNKAILGSFILAGILISSFIAFTAKRVWKGEFQIVIENKNKKESSIGALAPLADLAGLADIGNQKSALDTQVGILKSPSVLINIFEYVKKEKKLKYPNSRKKLTMRKFMKKLDIELEKKTTILNVSYKDTDKELILPVLNKISEAYQLFSTKKKLRNIELGLLYFEDQINFYKNKKSESLTNLHAFADKYNLRMSDAVEASSALVGSGVGTEGVGLAVGSPTRRYVPTTNIEANKILISSKLRYFRSILKRVNELKEDSNEILTIVASIEGLQNSPLASTLGKINSLEAELSSLRLTYTESDPSIKNLISNKNSLIVLLTKQVKNYLLAQIQEGDYNLKANTLPKGVLVKYKELFSTAAKDSFTLNVLENQYRATLLEKARLEDPWQLITDPALFPSPVAPRKRNLLAGGILGGAFLGTGSILFYDKRKSILYTIPEIESLVEWPVIAEVSANEKDSLEESMDLIVRGPLSDYEEKIALLFVGEIDNSLIDLVSTSLRNSLNNRELITTKDLREATTVPNLVVVSQLGVTKIEELINSNKKLMLQKNIILGQIVLQYSKYKI